MTTVREMIAFFQTMDPDTEVECGSEVTSGYNSYMEMKPVDIESCSVIDYSSEADRINYPGMTGRKFVHISAS